MTETTVGLEQTEQEIVAFSDEALESAAGEGASGELHTHGLQRAFCLPRLTSLFDWPWLLDLSLTAGPPKSPTRQLLG